MKPTKLDLTYALLFAFGLGAATAFWLAARVEVWRVDAILGGLTP